MSIDTENGIENQGNAVAIVNTALAAAEPPELDPTQLYSVTVPAGAEQKILDLEEYLPQPDRATGTYQPADVESFINYVGRHKDPEQTTVWVHPTEGRVVAVINDNAPGETGWGDHRAALTLTHTPEWDLWIGRDGKLLEQEAFAEHLREGMPEIQIPDAATLIEIAESFESTSGVHFRSKVDFASGARKFKYDETVNASATTAADGEIEVPRQFTLHIAPFLGEEPVEIIANLRHDARSGSLKIGYKLERPERAVEEALDRVAARLSDRFTDRVYRGTPA